MGASVRLEVNYVCIKNWAGEYKPESVVEVKMLSNSTLGNGIHVPKPFIVQIKAICGWAVNIQVSEQHNLRLVIDNF